MDPADTSDDDSDAPLLLDHVGGMQTLQFDDDDDDSLGSGEPAPERVNPRLSIDGFQIGPIIQNLDDNDDEQEKDAFDSDDDSLDSASDVSTCCQPKKKLVWDQQRREAGNCDVPNPSEWVNQTRNLLWRSASRIR